MAKWLAKEFDWDTGRYTGNYYDIAEAGIVAVFVDSHFGNDSNAGTALAPYKTLGAAITYLNANGANGSRIFMNGIFSENLPAQTYWYEFIGCGGGRNGRTLWSNQATVRPIISKPDTKIQNTETLNYDYSNIISYSFGSAAPNNNKLYINNCYFKKANVQINYYQAICSYNSILIECGFYGWTTNAYGGDFYGNKNIIIDPINNSPYNTMGYLNGNDNYFNKTFFIYQSGSGNVISAVINPQFINSTNGDYNVRITSPFIGTGSVDEITGNPNNVGGVSLGLPYNGLISEFSETGGATITDLTVDITGKYTITAPATTGTLETGLMDLGNIYPLENIDLFNVFDFAAGEITQGVFEDFVSPRMALTIKLKYGLTEAEVTECPWLLIEYGKQPTFSGTGASRVGNADATFDPDTFQEITCRYMKLFITLQNNS